MKALDLSLNETQKNSLKKVLVPGFQDSHMHLIEYGKFLSQVDLRAVKSISEMIGLLKPDAELEKVESFGWNQENFVEKRYPNRYDLDKIADDRPVLLSRICGHVTVVNSYVVEALAMEGVPAVDGGSIDVDSDGNPTGIFREKARDLLKEKGYYDATPDDLKKYILTAQEDLLKKGVTTVHSDDLASFPNLSWKVVVKAFEDLMESGQLILKVVEQANVSDAKELRDTVSRLRGKRFEIGSIKRFTDGSLGARTAHLREPYNDAQQEFGIQLQSDEQLIKEMETAYKAGIPLSIHAIGDRAIERVLSCFEALSAPKEYYGKSGIIHCQITSQDLLVRMKALGLRAYVQPIFLHEDAKIVYDRLGENRACEAYVWRTMHEMGIPLFMGSDAPIDTPDVIKGLYCAVERKTLDQQPISFLKGESLTIDQALEGYVRDKDSQDDWVLLDMPLADCLKTPHENHVVNVWVNGEWVL
ncbi:MULTISPECIES: amidohydrolase [unclassified Fusibacter]|uniref:amidohydrolase n=1 Tax=unclassified Fusibacter TaxID=2624464 RepID=UPI0013E965A3|nr:MULTISPECIES: amidohydrolase [unclassified Fusibacter]MCK8059347.1 amidohydrolase [Fusibacter sp. A2]NPE21189.1 amidohydrolase [Fusibacter sp. A1]